jgi:6-pyruvoyltetrahydropterin/6-carboxytetrahydropterin synthase
MLAIGIHAKGMGESELPGVFEAGFDGGAFAGVFREAVDAEALGWSEVFESVIRAIRGAIDDDENLPGMGKRRGDGGAQQLPTGIVGRDEDDHARLGHRRPGFRVARAACQTLIVIVPGPGRCQSAGAMRARLTKSFHFEAAHTLPSLPEDHKCRRMHGHSFKLAISIEGEVDEKIGWIYDHKRISDAMKPLLDLVDHAYLNEIEGLESPTIERMAAWFWRKLEPSLPGLVEITIHETPSASCTFRGEF